MRLVLITATLLLSHCDAGRRPRTTTSASTTADFEGRQLGFAGQPEDLENLWDHIEIQKLENRPDSWKKNPVSAANATEFAVPNLSTGRQYPGFPGNPGDSNELPNPITIEPQPPLPPGCLAARGQFPSPKSCANYLNCWDDVVIEQTCPNGLLFNDVTLVCDFDYNVNCGGRPLPTPKPPLPPGTRVCPDPNGRYRSSTNCSEFYVCVVGKPIKFSCPRGLVYNDILNVCDYPYNVDCKGSATPKPQPPTYPPTYPPQPPTYPPQPPTYPPQPPTYPPQPSYPPTYPPQPGYPGNPWVSRFETDPWHQRPVSAQLEVDKQFQDEQALSNPGVEQDTAEAATIPNPWNILQAVPAGLSKVPCDNGEMHRLNEACTNVVVCRNGRPQLVQCPSGFTYDRPSDSCQPFTVAKC